MKDFKEFLASKVPGFLIGRSSMPQIKDQQKFIDHLSSLGIYFSFEEVPVSSITPVQPDIDQEKVLSINPRKFSNPIVVSDSYYILDGHHRFFSYLINDFDFIEVLKVDIGINKLLVLAKEYEEGNSG